MKKFVSFLLSIMLIFTACSLVVFASNNDYVVSETTEFFEDGSYLVTTLVVEQESVLTRATSTKTGSRTAILFNSSDEKLVTLKLTGTFSYTGSSATCTSSSTSYTIHEDSWRVTSAIASKSGRQAIGNFTSKHYMLGIPIQTRETTITISCSNTGVLS